MRDLRPPAPLALIAALATTLYGCQQSDQELPFGLDPSAGQTVTVNASGGTVSVPPSFSIDFPPGALTGSESVTAQQRLTVAFPADAGSRCSGARPTTSAPAGTQLSPIAPARVRIGGAAEALLEAGDELSLSVASPAARRLDRHGRRPATTSPNGILTADVYELGPGGSRARRERRDSVIGDIGDVPPLGWWRHHGRAPTGERAVGRACLRWPSGSTSPPSCSPGEPVAASRPGIARLWVDDVTRDRLG